ncbi:relaxase/mobilization nuclease domain-containing protein [Paracoccus sp. (in: a-proteobacteria)]|uniref:relaxase/mobilization nuclease domain-containing protein n=1 Tax=Paracoccus sp. TaxID=267 RepID=UPI00321F9527
MIAKIRKGAEFDRLARYLTADDRGEVLDMRNLASETPADAAQEMQVAASVSVRTRQPVMHIVVSYDPRDGDPSNEDMRQDAAEVLRGLGLSENQAMVIRHRDKDHAHMHIMANRVGADGRVVSDSNSYAKAEAALRQIEAERGLTAVAGRHAPDMEGQRMTGPRSSHDPRQHTAPESVRQTLLTARSKQALDSGLARDGWRMEITQKPGKKPGAVLIGPEGQRIGAGKIDRNATLAKVNARIKDGDKPTEAADARIGARMTAPHGAGTGMMKLPGRKAGKPASVKKAGTEGLRLIGQIAASTAKGGVLLGAAAAGRRRKPGQRGIGGLSL